MAPTTSLVTAGTTNFNMKKPHFQGGKPITTQEKIAAYEWKKLNAKSKARSPPAAAKNADGSEAKTQKAKTLPPPCEIFQKVKEPKKGRGVRGARCQRPMTTQEKLQKSELLKTITKSVDKAKKKEEKQAAMKAEWLADDGKKDGPSVDQKSEASPAGRAKKVAKAVAFKSISATMMESETTTTTENRPLTVLERSTARARAERDKIARAKATTGIQGIWMAAKAAQYRGVFQLMDLPEEVRNRIWKLAVVYHPFCVRPDFPRDREQPDLAMTSREVRQAVLPIYYGLNIFAVDVAPIEEQNALSGAISKVPAPPAPQEGETKAPELDNAQRLVQGPADSIHTIARLSNGIGKDNFKQIRHWLFDYTTFTPRPRRLDQENSFVVYLELTDNSYGGKIEIHREACCVLPGSPDYEMCVLRDPPGWLVTGMNMILRSAKKKGGIDGEMIEMLAMAVRARAAELVLAKCESVVRSTEVC